MAQGSARILAVLGPTNTGKTHLAVERMLAHATGVIGLPLRLLAREIYDRIVRQKGVRSVALVTGEEKIVPQFASWFVCTVEAMPLDRDFDFLAVDEIQLIGDAERGHVFTDRLLRARGRQETMFMGAETVRGLIRRLVPQTEFETRPRFSNLSYAGSKKLSRLPRRSAIVAFSAQDVYGIAELVRRQRGGAAVVMGALSPRTRNAQVALYQSGEVDFLVATDAIGMGLNMDIDHVAFAATRKFDGARPRPLTAAEVGQIAGRAGRHMTNGTFGTTGEIGPLDAELVEKVENHRFDPVSQARWRNAALDFDSLPALLRALDAPSPNPALLRARDAEDYLTLKALAGDPFVQRTAVNPAALRLLWQVCQIPDFRKTLHDAHVRLLGHIYRHLAGPGERLPHDWVARQMAQLDRTDGDIDTLAARLAHIRTWTYVSHHPEWLADARHWQERALAIEDRLSDALHERLTQRFVDRRTAALARGLRDRSALTASIADGGEVSVEGQYVGRLEGLQFFPDIDRLGSTEARHLRNAAGRALAGALQGRAAGLLAVESASLALNESGEIEWQHAPVARLVRGDHVLRPRLKLVGGDDLDGTLRDRLQRRLEDWLKAHIAAILQPLVRLESEALSGAARGIAFQLGEALGALPRRLVVDQVRTLGQPERSRLRALGVKFGEASIFVPSLLKPEPARLKCLLWSIHAGQPPMPPPTPGLTSVAADGSHREGWWQAAGFARFGGRAVRLDMLERVALAARKLAEPGRFAPEPALLSLLGCRRDELKPVLLGLGYSHTHDGDAEWYSRPARSPKPHRRKAKPRRPSESPFAKLKELVG